MFTDALLIDEDFNRKTQFSVWVEKKPTDDCTRVLLYVSMFVTILLMSFVFVYPLYYS